MHANFKCLLRLGNARDNGTLMIGAYPAKPCLLPSWTLEPAGERERKREVELIDKRNKTISLPAGRLPVACRSPAADSGVDAEIRRSGSKLRLKVGSWSFLKG